MGVFDFEKLVNYQGKIKDKKDNPTMNATVLMKTKSNANYFHSGKINQFLLIHPVLNFLLDLQEQGTNMVQWMKNLNSETLEIENYGTFSRHEIQYYYNKLLLLKLNGYFETVDFQKKISGRLRPITIKSNLANTLQVTYENTDSCNLNCTYCAYGTLYGNYDERKSKNLSISTAKNVLNYLLEFWNSNLNRSHGRDINISFYGGEPLLNFEFIREIVDYSRKLQFKHNSVTFGMTSNGVVLHKYMDFLADNDFSLVISLDGNEKNNGYRVFHNGRLSFETVYNNILLLRDKYPQYFEKNVRFNCVLHRKNSVSEILKFFKEHFNIVPNISEISPLGINPDKKEEFWRTYRNYNESLHQSEDYSLVEREMFIRLPDARLSFEALVQYSGYFYDKYDDLIFTREHQPFIPTGTCLPFSRKVFVTVNGKILPCERVGHQWSFGHADETNVTIDFEKAAGVYNKIYDKLSDQCGRCYNMKTCGQCVLLLTMTGERPVCRGFMNHQDFSQYLSSRLSYLEEHPELFEKSMKEITIV